MTPKIVTRLANIAAKLAGSDKYDSTIEPVTAFEYYLDKGVDKILAIKGVPAVEADDVGKVLTAGAQGAGWESNELVVNVPNLQPTGDYSDGLALITDEASYKKFKSVIDALNQHKNVTLYISRIDQSSNSACFRNFVFTNSGFYCKSESGDFEEYGIYVDLLVALGTRENQYEMGLIFREL